MDYSTIDVELLKKLPVFRLPGATSDDVVAIGKWSLQDTSGNGCFLDAPGYPTYFTRSVYRGGNQPHSGATMVITYEGKHYTVATYDDTQESMDTRLRKLWKPLPLNHERVQLWICELHRHLANCYADDELKIDGKDRTFIYPVPEYKLKHFVDDERFSDWWRQKAKEEVEAYNADVIARTEALVNPDNHRATREAKRFYLDYEPRLDLIEKPPRICGAMWWETEATKPTPATCKPRNGIGHMSHEGDADEWCQWCGWNGGV